MMTEIIQAEKKETWAQVAKLEKKVAGHDNQLADHDNRLKALESKVLAMQGRGPGSSSASTTSGGSASGWTPQYVTFRVCDFEEKGRQGARRPQILAFRDALV